MSQLNNYQDIDFSAIPDILNTQAIKPTKTSETVMPQFTQEQIQNIADTMHNTGTCKINDDYSIQVNRIYADEHWLLDCTGEKYPIKDGLTDVQAVEAAIKLIS